MVGASFAAIGAVDRLQSVLPDLGTTDLHFVADDWSGSGNWTDRKSSVTATLHGTLTKRTSLFAGRSEILGFTTSNYFDLAATADNTLSSGTQRSFEILMYNGDSGGSGVGTCLGYYNANGAVDAGNLGLFAPDSHNLRAIVFNDNDSFRYDYSSSGAVTSQYSLYTLVWNDASDGKLRIYRDGVLLTAQSATGTLSAPSNQPWGIGAIRQASGAYGAATNGRILELVRHQSALSATVVAQRASQLRAQIQSLPHLPTTATTDMHFVADDWSGSGNWVDRKSGYAAVPTGSITRQTSSLFAGRYEVTGFASNGSSRFATASATAHALTTGASFTYDVIVKFPAGDLAGTVGVVCGGSYFAAGASTVTCVVTGGFRSHNGQVRDGSAAQLANEQNTSVTLSAYYLFTVVFDVVNKQVLLYKNGVLAVTGSVWSSAAASPGTSIAFTIGADALGNLPLDNGTTIIEIMRHRSVLSGSDIAARAATFNTLKGY